MSTDDISPRHKWLQFATTVVAWSLSAALLWSLYDAPALAEGVGVSFGQAWVAAIGTAVVVAAAAAIGGLAVGWLWHHKSFGQRLRRLALATAPKSAALISVFTMALIALSATVFGALAIFRKQFGSELVHQLALSLTVPAAALILTLMALALVPFLTTFYARIQPPPRTLWVATLLNAAFLLAWGFGLTRLGYEVWQHLPHAALLAMVIIGAGALGGALTPGHRRWQRIPMGLALIALIGAGASLFAQPTQSLRLALVYGASGTGHLQTLWRSSEGHQFASAQRNRDGSASCFPDVEPTAPTALGTVDESAPDIIWLTIDALRWDRTTMGGYRRDTTPNLAKYAAEAALFEHAYTPATSTRQSFRALFTGTHPSMIDPPRGPMWALTLPEEQYTIAEYLSTAGYATTALSSEDKIFSADHGGLRGFETIDERPVEAKIDQGYSAPLTIDLILERLEQDQGPQFIWSHLIEPHQPYRPGPDPVDFGDDDEDRYDASLHFTDAQVARLLEAVAQRQGDRPTYLIITSDHGHAFGEHGTFHHGRSVFDVESRVPLMIWGPDIEADRHTSPVAVLDIFATTFDLAGLDTPQGSCATSLDATLRGGAPAPRRPVYLEQVPDYSRTHFAAALVDRDHKLIVEPRAQALTLFDLAQDPGEKQDLSSIEPEKVDDLLAKLHDYWSTRGMAPEDYGR